METGIFPGKTCALKGRGSLSFFPFHKRKNPTTGRFYRPATCGARDLTSEGRDKKKKGVMGRKEGAGGLPPACLADACGFTFRVWLRRAWRPVPPVCGR